jgi:enoyl-CoA hydratase/carnithine racemase
MKEFDDLAVAVGDDFVATITIDRPPHNYFDASLMANLRNILEEFDDDDAVRVSILRSNGRSFCAGANFKDRNPIEEGPSTLYQEARRLFETTKPVVGEIQGAAIGGGLGLALFPDFRVAANEARFAANFSRIGLHHGFGITATLPRIVGEQVAMSMLLTGRSVSSEEALAVGLVDVVVAADELSAEAHRFALEIASCAPLAVQSIRKTMRGDLAKRVSDAMDLELTRQQVLIETEDFAEGVRATAERRTPIFKGR